MQVINSKVDYEVKLIFIQGFTENSQPWMDWANFQSDLLYNKNIRQLQLFKYHNRKWKTLDINNLHGS